MGLEDIAMMRAVAGSTVLYPSDAVSAEKLMDQMASHKGICFLRTSRPKTAILYTNDEAFPIGGAKVLRQVANDKVTVVAAGVTLYEALKAADQLKSEGMGITVIDSYSIKPLGQRRDPGGRAKDQQSRHHGGRSLRRRWTGRRRCRRTQRGGMKVHKLAVRELPHSGKPEELLAKYGIDAQAIVKAVKSLG